MSNDSRGGVAGEAPRVGADTIELRMRERIRDTIEEIVEGELVAALGAGPSSRVSERPGIWFVWSIRSTRLNLAAHAC